MVIDLGLIDYRECHRIQKEFVGRRKLGKIEDSVILAEHPAVFTIGRSSKEENLIAGRKDLLKRGIEVIYVDRGGDITFHGPGQLVVYPILDLKKRAKDLHLYLRDLEEAAIGFLDEYSICAGRISGKTGVWVDGEKISSIGIAASDWITYHGLSINVNVDLRFFSMMHPCGMRNIKVTSLGKILGKSLDMDEVKDSFMSHFNEVFGLGGKVVGTRSPALVA